MKDGYTIDDLDPSEHPLHEAMAEVGLVEPFFAEVPDGHYTHRVVMDSLPTARFITEDEPPVLAEYHLEPCRIPRTRRELRWRTAE